MIVVARQRSDIIVLLIAYYIIAYVILNARHDARLFRASNARVRALSSTLNRVHLPPRVVTGSRTLPSPTRDVILFGRAVITIED